MTTSGLFAYVETLQGGTHWGAFLDAGTGTHSIGWVLSLATERWTAVSGAPSHAAQVRRRAADAMRPADRILVGNWADPGFLAGERFDTVLADYLLGAVEGFAPYFQAGLFARLRALTRRRLYLIGLEPYVTASPADEAGRLVREIGRFRDSCLLLAGETPYREYPLDRVLSRLRRAGFAPVEGRLFPIRYKARFVNSQIDMCASRLRRLPDRRLAASLGAHGEALRERALAHAEREGGLRHGFDYVVAADPV